MHTNWLKIQLFANSFYAYKYMHNIVRHKDLDENKKMQLMISTAFFFKYV